MNFKKLLITLITFSTLLSPAQAFNDENSGLYIDKYQLTGTDEPRIGVGVKGGSTKSAVDFGMNGSSYIFGLQLNTVPVRFLHVNVDVDYGQLKGGPIQLQDLNMPKMASFTSDFVQANAVVRLLPLRLFMWDKMHPSAEFISYIYGGIGVGYNSWKTTAPLFMHKDFGSLGNNKDGGMVIIQEVGIDIPITKFKQDNQWFVNLNYRYNKLNTDNIDGFNPIVSSNKHKDSYNSFTLGIMYKF